MNILKEFAKIFIKSKLDDEKRKLKQITKTNNYNY